MSVPRGEEEEEEDKEEDKADDMEVEGIWEGLVVIINGGPSLRKRLLLLLRLELGEVRSTAVSVAA